jgi:hypothetical protein
MSIAALRDMMLCRGPRPVLEAGADPPAVVIAVVAVTGKPSAGLP